MDAPTIPGKPEEPKHKRLSIKWIGSGIADNVDGVIYLHQKLQLKQFDRFRKSLIAHEREHTPGPYGVKDWKNDMGKAALNMTYIMDALWFLSQTPSAWMQFSPLRTYGGKHLYFDRQLLITYAGILISGLLAWTIF
jgi:hypothetical protein